MNRLFADFETDGVQQWFRRSLLSLVIWLSLGLVLALGVHAAIEANRITCLTIAAGLPDGESYHFAQAMAQVVARYEPKLQIQVLETPGTTDNLNRLQARQVQLATAQADLPAPPTAQLVSLLFPDVYQLVATVSSNIQSVADLKGKRVALPPRSGGQYKSFQFLAQHYGLNPDDPQYVAMSDDQSTDQAFLNHQVDAVFHVRPPGNSSILQLVQKGQGQLIPIDQAAAMKIKQPALDEATIPKGTYQGTPPIPKQSLPTVAVQRLLLAGKEVDRRSIQTITSLLYERRQELVAALPLIASIHPPSTLSGTGLPIHPGAQAYYEREKPPFIEEHAQVFEFLLSTVVLLGSGFWQLKLQIEKKQKEKADDYIEEVMTLLDVNDCIKNVVALEQSHQSEATQRLSHAIADQVNSITAVGQRASQKKKLSNDSLRSFQLALELLQQAIERLTQRSLLPSKATLPQTVPASLEAALQTVRATLEQRTQRSPQWLQTPHPPSDLDALRAKLDSLSQGAEFASPAFSVKSTDAIRRALDTIFKRATKALMQERVSPESFQSFRTVWQIAISELPEPTD